MSDWAVVWLATIAIAVVVIAIVQVSVMVALVRLVMQAVQSLQQLQRELSPLIAKATRIADDASRAAAMAAAQMERIDEVITTAAERIDDTLEAVQSAILEPLRRGSALFAGLRAVLSLVRGWRDRAETGRDEDDPLFIG